MLVDYRTADDAGVYALDSETALVQTVDFFTPIVDDPDAFGRIAAANALSDVYAMGGTPITALAIAAFPVSDFDPADMRAVFAGGHAVLHEAGVALLGGHTVQDQEVKFGYAVTGLVRPGEQWTNTGARPGDVVFLTKSIGTGIIATAIKAGAASRDVADAAVTSMVSLNGPAADAVRRAAPGAVHACTDITGFGLLGHLSEMAEGSGVTVDLLVDAVPILPGARELAAGYQPGGTKKNATHFGSGVRLATGLDARLVALLYDAQTSGGLVFAIRREAADVVAAAMDAAGVAYARVGEVRERVAGVLIDAR